MFLNIFIFFQGGVPENFDPEKGGSLKILREKRGVFENFRRPPPIFWGGVHLNYERSLKGVCFFNFSKMLIREKMALG